MVHVEKNDLQLLLELTKNDLHEMFAVRGAESASTVDRGQSAF